MSNYARYVNTKRTPQNQPIPGQEDRQVKNSAGGYVYETGKWPQLDRFLVLGSSGGTYYVGERKLTLQNAKNVRDCIKDDGVRVVSRTVEISRDGRAPRNDEALFVLAMCVAFGDKNTRQTALHSLSQVARTGTHLFQFVHFVTSMTSWNRSLRTAIANWYNEKSASDVAYQVVKYQSRRMEEGNPASDWSHKDVLRLVHPRPATELHSDVFRWAIWGWDCPEEHVAEEVSQIWAFEAAKRATVESEIVGLINDYRLTREMIPTQWLNYVNVWEALLQHMPLTAMIRNLGKMTEVGLISRLSNASVLVSQRLRDQEYLRKSRIHPLKVLVAMRTYAQGGGIRGKLTWNPVGQVVDALDDAFYLSFGNVEPTGKRMCLALDVSGSMGAEIAKMPIRCCEATAAMSMVTARTEQNYYITAFCDKLVQLPITPRQRLDDVMRMTQMSNFGGTDCALPMIEALNGRIPVDAFIVYTDNETWAGYNHPIQALNNYRNKMGIDARLVVVGMTATDFTIADPNDGNSLDIVGFDTAAPQLISDFVAGKI